ncbi:UNKNOWN [Stylonychia lemnae]|uniref:Uncharacterized protein n=1 Tax=Stylonychia lemnae TaxID=5949 RepID=A0A077ZRK1_STYLE|nr:UNKNOWN [Stylonychia lemnae]|eukprot:CDW72094.1 UNKNOWN [Stylonychia lemnae]
MCAPAKSLNENCTFDYECQNQYVCSKVNTTHAKTCLKRWSLPEGSSTSDPRLCLTSFTTTKGICSLIQSSYQIRNTSTDCNINSNNGKCVAIMNFDKSERSDLIFCQCSLFDTVSYCRWPGLSISLRFYNLASKLYQQSPYCSRSSLLDDPLKINFAEIKSCTSLSMDLFKEFVDFANRWIYAAPLKSSYYNSTCFEQIAVTSQKQLGSIVNKGHEEVYLEEGIYIKMYLHILWLCILTLFLI